MTVDVTNRGLEVRQYLGAEAHHPRRAFREAERAERDHELAEPWRRNLPQRRFERIEKNG